MQSIHENQMIATVVKMELNEFAAYTDIEDPPDDFKLVGYAMMIIRYNQ